MNNFLKIDSDVVVNMNEVAMFYKDIRAPYHMLVIQFKTSSEEPFKCRYKT